MFWRIYLAREIKASEMRVPRWITGKVLNFKHSGNFCIFHFWEVSFLSLLKMTNSCILNRFIFSIFK